MARRRTPGRACLAAILLLAVSCSRQALPSPPATSPNLVVVSIDTLRADHLGAYGYPRPTSPRLDALASESLLYLAAYAPAPWTLPSHAALLTGVHPHDLGIDSQRRTLPADVPTLAETLAAQGYRTAAFVDSSPEGFVGARRGFDRGFELYQHGPHSTSARQRFDVAATVDAALSWLDRLRESRPYFLFLHSKSVHALAGADRCRDERCLPYDQPEPYRLHFVDPEAPRFEWRSDDGVAVGQAYLWTLNERVVEGDLDPREYPAQRLEVLVAAYDGGIRWVDAELGRFFDGLRARGHLEDTVLVVTSDHGESFLDQDLFMHQELGDQTLRVPLIVRLPDSDTGAPDPGASSAVVVLEDIVPTLLDLAGTTPSPQVTGRRLPLSEERAGPAGERDLFAYYRFPGRFRYEAYGLQRGSRRLVIDNLGPSRSPTRSRLFELTNGSREVATHLPAETAALERDLGARMTSPPLAQGPPLREKDSQEQDLLRGLGYIE